MFDRLVPPNLRVSALPFRPKVRFPVGCLSPLPQSGNAVTAGIAWLELEAQQVLNQVIFFAAGEPEVHALVVMVDYSVQISETSVVIEAAFEMSRQGTDR